MADFITVSVNGREPIQIEKYTRIIDIAKKYANVCKYPVLLAKINNQLEELNKQLVNDCRIELLDITNSNGYRTYQRSTSFLMICAVKEILGVETRVIVEHSISKNFYCEIEKEGLELTDEIIKTIEERMVKLASEDIPIEKVSLPTEEGLVIARDMGLKDKERFLKYRRTANVNFYKMGWFYDYFYGHIVPSTGYLKVFRLTKQINGFMLQFPDVNNPSNLSVIKPHEKISKIFAESANWTKIMKVDTVPALNDIICRTGAKGIIQINEALHEKKISNIADMIHDQNKRLVLIAGPSSSGKTTFANRLGVQLSATGLRPHIISLDNYYIDRDLVPLDEFGEKDFETIDSIDVSGFNRDVEMLMAGKEVQLPTFNFISGKREYKGKSLKLSPEDVVVVEGIHGLNEKIGSGLSKDLKFRIFISALTQLSIDDHNRIPTSDTRLLRRLVRDIRHRGASPELTISMWPSVARGEAKHIFPYQENADAMFNSALTYELCILKLYVEPLLFSIPRELPEYAEARRLLKFLDSFLGIAPDAVPSNSLLREFIGGSCF